MAGINKGYAMLRFGALPPCALRLSALHLQGPYAVSTVKTALFLFLYFHIILIQLMFLDLGA